VLSLRVLLVHLRCGCTWRARARSMRCGPRCAPSPMPARAGSGGPAQRTPVRGSGRCTCRPWVSTVRAACRAQRCTHAAAWSRVPARPAVHGRGSVARPAPRGIPAGRIRASWPWPLRGCRGAGRISRTPARPRASATPD
jgi:hypothetical protein